MSNKNDGQPVIDKVWNLFSSITFAIVVFSLISLTSIVGTVIEQRVEPEKNIKLLTKFVGESFAPTAYRVLDSLGFMNMYQSWWFIALLLIFAANIVICSLDRLPKIWNMIKEPIKPVPQDVLNAMPIKREILLKTGIDKAKEAVEAELKKIGYKASVSQEPDGIQLYAEKGRYSRLGVYATHLSILLILIGAVVGIFFGFNGFLNLLEGTSSDVAYIGREKEIPLGFQIKCDDFDVQFYGKTDRPKEFSSWLTIIDNGREVVKKQIEVNAPLKYKGITFYQSSYGFWANENALFKFSLVSSDGKREDVMLKFGESFTMPGTNITGKISDFSPALKMDASGKPYTYAEMMHNPAVYITFSENGEFKYRTWILSRYPQSWRIPDGVVEFKDFWGSQYTGLQVRRDPGVWIVYLGSIIMTVGLYASFFMSHARIWVMLKDDKKNTKVSVSASINKNRVSLEEKIEKVIRSLSH